MGTAAVSPRGRSCRSSPAEETQEENILQYEYDVAKSKRRIYRVLDLRYKEKSSEWVACSAPVEKKDAGAWKIPAIHLVDGGAGDSAVVKGKSYEYHVLAGVSGPGNFDLYIDAHLNGGSAGVTESSSSSGKVKSKKTQAEVLVAQVSPGLY